MGRWPAVDVTNAGDSDLTLAIVDDFSPTAVEPHADKIRIFFATSTARDGARAALAAARYSVQPVDVDDEDWARRSQADLKPVTVGRVTVSPPWFQQPASALETFGELRRARPATSNQQLVIVQPSTGFGTGHHATTRLCLRALQTLDLSNRFVLDVGTGSGVLALAAVRLGAARALGIDCDADAIRAAIENRGLNSGIEDVEFRVADLSTATLPAADVVTANLTGAFLVRSAGLLAGLTRPGGTLIVSGFLNDERNEIVRAFRDAGSKRTRPTNEGVVGRVLSDPPVVWEEREDGWAAVGMCCN